MNDKRTTDEIDALAQEIRRVDGENNLGAGALAEALQPFLTELQHRREAEAGIDAAIAEGLDGAEQAADEQLHYLAQTAFNGKLSASVARELLVRRKFTASPSSPASGVRVIGYVTEEALKLMLTVKPKSGWHYHMFAKDQADAKATIAIYASDAAALSALGEHP